ncbi:MAG: 3'(2'),5'-bisphosphate nucleotidase CysQ [Alphaproteobacteria bacterium]|nr:3'(2'),5'-bisphosphate nucleotidase CysQ [Alphaproteobacteria bacterium]
MPHSLRDELIAVSREAGAAILNVYSRDFEASHKHDRSPVTEADTAAEALIVEALGRLAPDVPVVAEEQCAANGVPADAAERFFLVDPLDGTKEFIAKNGEFCVCIGLVEDGRPAMGVLHGPARDVIYAAHGPGTALRIRGAAAAERIAPRAPASDGIDVIHSRTNANSRRLAEYFEGRPIRKRISCGSALKFGVLAAGEADLYPRFGTTMEWDTAAGQAILEAAGGSVVRVAGGPLAYGKDDLKNDAFLAWGAKPAW